MNRKTVLLATAVTSVAAVTIGLYVLNGSPRADTHFQERLAACGSILNGSSTDVVQTTRMFINLPRDIYPNINLQVAPHGAMAAYVSNGGAYGYAIGAQGKPNCWSYYLDFELTPDNKMASGKVDIGSKSGAAGIPNYLIHFNVIPNPSDATSIPSSTPSSTPSSLKGNVHGQVLLGPTCPVERVPPDPACAPKPYETTVEVLISPTGNPYKTVTTNSSGEFSFSLDPGAYVLRAKSGAVYPRCTDTPIKVSAGTSQNVILNCDTGIR